MTTSLLSQPLSQRDVIVIGGSAGGVSALLELCRNLPADLQASVYVVVHIGRHPSRLPELLRASGPLEALYPTDGQAPERGKIYVAPPDHHLLLDQGRIRLSRGPKEHHTRPAIDPLFRSAALNYDSRTIGVVLSGHLDDGTSGLQAIKQCGGMAVVQDPGEAEASGMPASALENVAIDHCVRLRDMASILVQLSTQVLAQAHTPSSPTSELAWEHEASLGELLQMDTLQKLGSPSTFVCPECKGPLWAIRHAHPPRYRCHTGHAYSLQSLTHHQADNVEDALWAALRALQEREYLLRRQIHIKLETLEANASAVMRRPDLQALQTQADLAVQQARQIQQLLDEKPTQAISSSPDHPSREEGFNSSSWPP